MWLIDGKAGSISRCMWMYEADLAVYVLSFIQAQWDRWNEHNHQT